MERLLPPRLLGLSPGDLVACDGAGHDRFRKQVGDLVDAGLRGVLLREPALDDLELLAIARELSSILQGVDGGWLGVHDSLHVAMAAKSDGAHIGFRSLSTLDARRVIGDRIALGVSTHAGDAPDKWQGADYIFRSPVFETDSKNGLLEPIGLDGLDGVCAASLSKTGPAVFALGGITPSNCGELLGDGRIKGLYGIAVRGALFDHDHARHHLADFLGQIEGNQGDSRG